MAFLAVVFIAGLVGLDQLTKFLAVKYIGAVGSIPVFEGILRLTLVENKGAAFGIMQGARWFFVLLTIVVMGIIIVSYRRLPRTRPYAWIRFALVLVGAGAVGNFIDRLLNGYVVDFLLVEFIDFPVFNLADIYVVVGTALLAVIVLFFMKDEKPEAKADEPRGPVL